MSEVTDTSTTSIEQATEFFLKTSKGDTLQPDCEFRGLHLKGREGAELICDCCGDGDDCCGFN